MTTGDLTLKKQRFDDAVFVAANLEHKRLTTERELQDLRWFAYRFMTPLAATRLFYDTYRRHRVDYVREHKDVELARELPVVSFDDFVLDPKNLALAWSARQAADTFCFPYEYYVEFCFWFWSRRGGGHRSKVPQINQLCYTEKSRTAWHEEFEKFRNDRIAQALISLTNVPQLKASAFKGTVEQVAARTFIMDQLRGSARPWSWAIEYWCHTHSVLTPGCFAAVLPPDKLTGVLETTAAETSYPISSTAHLVSSALWPSCHGMPRAKEATHNTCMRCKFSGSCSALAAMVQNEVLAKTGYNDPRKAALRAPANARQRNLTARKRAAADISSLVEPSLVPELIY